MKIANRRGILYPFFFIPFLIETSYLLAFYPGVLSFDSVNQWAQLSQFNFSNWHPAYHTILMWFITRIWYSPAAVALFQILVFSIVVGYGLSTFRKELDIPYALLVVVGIIISVVPLNGIMIITLWKDALYSIFILLLTIYVLRIIHTEGSWIASGHNWIYFGLTIANISLLRHNGFPIAFGALFACMLFRGYRKYFVKSLAVSLLFIIVVVGPVYKIFKVDRSSDQSLGVIFVHPIAAQINAGTELTKNQERFLNEIFPLKQVWDYSCYDATILFYKGVNFQPVQQHPFFTAKTFIILTVENPKVTIDHFICLSSFIWQLQQPNNVYLETILTSNITLNDYPDWKIYENAVTQNSKMPILRDFIVKVMENALLIDPDRIFWRPAIYLYLFTLLVMTTVFKSGNRLVSILLVPVLLQSLIIGLTGQLQALRYQYPVYVTSMLFSVPLLYLVIKNTKKLRMEKLDYSIPEKRPLATANFEKDTIIMPVELSVIVPAYNEEQTIVNVLESLLAHFRRLTPLARRLRAFVKY